MKCTNCEKEIEAVREGESHNSKDGTAYTRTVYECKDCGTWITTEIPKK